MQSQISKQDIGDVSPKKSNLISSVQSILLYDLNTLFWPDKKVEQASKQQKLEAEAYKGITLVSAAKDCIAQLVQDKKYPGAVRQKTFLVLADVAYQALPLYLVAPLAYMLQSGTSFIGAMSLATGLIACWTLRSWAHRNRELIDETIFRRAWRMCENNFFKNHLARSLRTQQDLGYNDKVTKVREQGNRLASFTLRTFDLITNFSAASLAIIGVAIQLPAAGLVIAANAGLLMANYLRYARDFNSTENKVAEGRRTYWYTRGHITTAEATRDIKLLDKEQEAIERVSSGDDALAEPRLADTRRLVQRNRLPSYLSLATNVSVLTYIAYLTRTGVMPSEVFMQVLSMVIYAEFQLTQAAKAISMQLQDFVVAREALAINRQGEPERDLDVKYNKLNTKLAPTIEFKDLGYTSSSGVVILDGINLILEPGKVFGFAGKSGSGKTTLIRLLMGEIKPTAGSILLNGIDIHAVDPEDKKEIFRYLAQNYATFESLTVRQSIELGVPSSQNGKSLAAALKLAQIDFVDGEELNTVKVGAEGQFSGARPFSLGERQRIAIARTVAAQSPVLILDEPGASLDHDNEDQILQGVIDIVKDKSSSRMLLLISHRYANLQHADRIFFFTKEQGITEQGSHAELVRENKEYARLVRLESAKLQIEDRMDKL